MKRLGLVTAAALLVSLGACAAALPGLTGTDMGREARPYSGEVEEGVYNLTAASLHSTAEEIGAYIFYTNSTEIQVTVEAEGDFHGTVMLWDTENSDSFIQIAEVDETEDTCVFTGKSAAKRYRITCEGLEGASVTVGDGGGVSFWRSLERVAERIVGR